MVAGLYRGKIKLQLSYFFITFSLGKGGIKLLKNIAYAIIFYMKKIVKVFSLIIAPLVLIGVFLSGCKKGKAVDIDNGGIMQDMDVAPTQTPAYEQYSRQAIAEYKAVAARHTDEEGEVDTENGEVLEAARTAAAKLYAYACYNERTLDKYVYFSHQDGETDLGASGAANAHRQEYYLRVNESGDTCGYRYHYTIKKVIESSGIVAGFNSLFESARLRFTDKTNLLYRFEGDKIRVGEENERLGCNVLACDWKTGADWGKPDIEMKKSEYIEPENIKADIEANAGEENITIRGNINILADDIIKHALILEDDVGDGVMAVMTINTAVANSDDASLKMLRKANSSNDCIWVDSDEETSGLMIVFRVWGNGLFRFYSISEKWSGKIEIFNGAADSSTTVNYSYSDRDCDMTKNLEMLEAAKKAKAGE